MSRGPGRWQRLLLDGIQQHDSIHVIGYAWQQAGPLTRAQEVAVCRAAKTLAQAGKATATRERCVTADGKRVLGQLVLSGPDSGRESNVIHSNDPDWHRLPEKYRTARARD